MATYYVAGIPYSDELYHHGVKGQKWGVTRSPEELGYDVGQRIQNGINRLVRPAQRVYEKGQAVKAKYNNVKQKLSTEKAKKRMKTAAKIGAGLAIAGLAAYGAYKINKGNFEYHKSSRSKDFAGLLNGYNKLHDDISSNLSKRKINSANDYFKLVKDSAKGHSTINSSYKRALNELNSDVKREARKDSLLKALNNSKEYYKGQRFMKEYWKSYNKKRW